LKGGHIMDKQLLTDVTKKSTFTSILTSVTNQLEGYEVKELIEKVCIQLDKKQREELAEWIAERFPSQTDIACTEEGLIEED